MTKKFNFGKLLTTVKHQKFLLAMMLPGLLFMLIFNYIPMYGIAIAFTDYGPLDTILSSNFVGLKNFALFLTDEMFWNALTNTLIISFGKLLIGFTLSIAVAILINELVFMRLQKVVQTISYLPYFLSWVIFGGMLISWLSEYGLINNALMDLGLITDRIRFMTDPAYYRTIAILSDVWKNLGWNTILYLAAMTSIDPALYEAATIDGANKFKQILHITLPGIRGIIAIMLVLSIGGMLNANLDQTLVLQNSLNVGVSEVIDSYVLKVGLNQGDFAYATAVGLFRSVIAIILVVSSNKLVSKISDRSIF